jgi:hypothetical protein
MIDLISRSDRFIGTTEFCGKKWKFNKIIFNTLRYVI